MRGSPRQRVERARSRAFERLVIEALDGLPPEIHAMLDNVEIVVEDEPSPDDLGPDAAPGDTLFGLYQGVPLTERGGGYSMVLPDKISIFRGPLEREFRTSTEIARQVRVTVIHELAHHVGIDDDRLETLGWQ